MIFNTTAIIDITSVAARDDSDIFTLKTTASKSATITTSGAGGLQTGSTEAADTWYGVYIIGDTTNTNAVNTLLIPDGTSFSQSGYDVKRRVGWVKNNGSSNLLKFSQHGTGKARHIYYDEASNTIEVLSAVGAIDFAVVSFRPFIPPTCTISHTRISLKPNSASGSASFRPVGSSHSSTYAPYRFAGGGSSANYARGMQDLPLNGSQEIEWRTSEASDLLYVVATGYRDEL